MLGWRGVDPGASAARAALAPALLSVAFVDHDKPASYRSPAILRTAFSVPDIGAGLVWTLRKNPSGSPDTFRA